MAGCCCLYRPSGGWESQIGSPPASLVPRDQGRVIHRVADILRARMPAISCGYEDADDLDARRHDPRLKRALGKLPGDAYGLASQPTISRWENAPTTRELVRLTGTRAMPRKLGVRPSVA